MAKKVQRYKVFNTVVGGGSPVKCDNCGKTIRGGYQSSNLLKVWSTYFCNMKCASAKGYVESTNLLYRIDKFIMGKGR